MKLKRFLKTLKCNLLVLSMIAAMIYLLVQINDPSPMGNAREILGFIGCGSWLTIFWYAQLR